MIRSLMLISVCATTFAAQTPVVIDGALYDGIWRNAVVGKLVPAEPGVSPDLGGEIRLAVAGRYLYISARMPEPSGRITARSMGRNPSWEEEDVLRIVVGPYPDYIVQVGPLGAYSVETKGQPVPTGQVFRRRVGKGARMDGRDRRAAKRSEAHAPR